MYVFFVTLPSAVEIASSSLPIAGSLFSDFLPIIEMWTAAIIALIAISIFVGMLWHRKS